MNKKIQSILLFLVLTLQTLPAQEDSICKESSGKSENNYLGFAQFNLISGLFDDNTAIALLGEIGPYNYRANGTLGAVYDCHMIKFGGEYLGQRLKYHFSTGNENHWVHQYAFGGRYEYLLCCDWFQSLFISGQAAHAPSKYLSDDTCTLGEVEHTFQRHLAGSTYYNVVAGIALAPWDCASFLVGAGYNKVRYDKTLECNDKNIQGVGVDLEFIQRFCNNFVLDLKGEFRRPYNYAEAALDWFCDTSFGTVSVGIFGGYVWGKTHLPNVTTAGLELGLDFGPFENCRAADPCVQTVCYTPCHNNHLRTWIASPAVYMPLVMVVAEEREPATCVAPTAVGTIPVMSVGCSGSGTINLANYFSGTGITYSISFPPGPYTITINPTTGEILYEGEGTAANTTVTLTATNSCGSANQIFGIVFQCF